MKCLLFLFQTTGEVNIESKQTYDLFSAHPIIAHWRKLRPKFAHIHLFNHYHPCQQFSQLCSLTNSAKNINGNLEHNNTN